MAESWLLKGAKSIATETLFSKLRSVNIDASLTRFNVTQMFPFVCTLLLLLLLPRDTIAKWTVRELFSDVSRKLPTISRYNDDRRADDCSRFSNNSTGFGGSTRCSDTGSKVVRARERSIRLSRVCWETLQPPLPAPAIRNVSTFHQATF